MAKSKKAKITWAVSAAALALILFAGFSDVKNPFESPNTGTDQSRTQQSGSPAGTEQDSGAEGSSAASSSTAEAGCVVYSNLDYGFSFALPNDWKGYSIVNSSWEGLAVTGNAGEKVVETGPIVSIRNPQWTSRTPTQDIPIMVFTLDQWNALQNDDFHIGAAPIGPSELGSNNKYVFAIPARYNYSFPKGYEEVESILAGNPLTATQAP